LRTAIPLRRAARLVLPLMLLATPPSGAAVQEGGFRFVDPEAPRAREGDLLSLGPLVLGAGRLRTSQPDGVPGLCSQLVFVMLGAQADKRKDDAVQVRQKGDVVAFFVVTECVGEDETCLVDASEAVSLPDCSGSIKLSTKDGVSGAVKFACKNGIDVTGAAFGLGASEQATLAAAFPGLADGLSLSFRDDAGEQLSQDDIDAAVAGIGADALDDVVGTYLADDDLPACD
jgi:hypothetical protein